MLTGINHLRAHKRSRSGFNMSNSDFPTSLNEILLASKSVRVALACNLIGLNLIIEKNIYMREALRNRYGTHYQHEVNIFSLIFLLANVKY